MRTIRTHFLRDNIRQDVLVTLVEEKTFAVNLESTDIFDDTLMPNAPITAGVKSPDLIIQKTKTNEWIALQDEEWKLSQEETQALGHAIENSFSTPI